MRPATIHFTAVLFCFFFISKNSIAQTISSQKGLTTAVFNMPQGNIKVYLPDDIRPGDVISGTVLAEPNGNTEKEKNRNGQSLQKYKVKLGDIIISSVSLQRQAIKFIQPPANLSIVLLDDKGGIISTIPIQVNNTPPIQPGNIIAPSHVLASSPIPIKGQFDGDASNTRCSLDGRAMEILAESPRQTICAMPSTTSGPHTLTVEEKDKTTEKKISAVNMELAAGKLNLMKGEKTYVDVTITGLQNLPSNATLSVMNTTTGVVTMLGGEVQVLPIPPAGVSGAGTFNKRFDLQSIKTGTFSVNVNLDLPEPPQSSAPTTSGWTTCNLGVTSCILPGATCSRLQKGITEKLTQEPLLPTTVPENNPYYSTKMKTSFIKDHVTSIIIQDDPEMATREELLYFTYEKISADYKTKKERKENKEWLLDKDSLSTDGFSVKTPLFRLDPGLYVFHATAYYGSNQTYTHNNYVVVPERRNPPAVSNAEIERLKREEQRLRDSVNAINRRIENGSNQINENYKRRRTLDSLRWVQSTLYNQLHQIDALIEQIPGEYGVPLQNLLDSLEKFRQKAGNLNADQLQEAVDKMQQEVDDLEAALKACLAHLAALQKEQQDLKNEKEQIQKDQQQAYRDIIDACRADGYNAGGSSGHTKTTGEFKYNYGLIMRGAGGNYEFVRGIPAGALKEVLALEKKIKEGNKRIGEINARQAALPAEIDKAKKECDDIAARLAKAKEALRKGSNNVKEYNYYMADLDELCSQIKRLLEPLATWCKQHPGECGGFENQLKQLMEDCPANLNALPNLMNSLGQIIQSKKQAEDAHKKQSESLGKQIDEIDRQNQGIGSGIGNDQGKAEGYGGALDKNMQDQDKAIAAELAKRQQAEAAKTAARKRVCVEFLKSQAQSEEEKSLIEKIAELKDKIQGMAENVKTASEIGDKITKDQLKELTDKLRDGIDKLLEEFEKLEKLKGKIDQLLDIKKDLETLSSGDQSAKAASEKMGVVLKRINEVLQDVGEKFPILQLFTAYFGFMVEAYNAIITGAFNAVTGEIVYYLNQSLAGKLNCESLVLEYQKRNSLDDAVAMADKICRKDDAFMLGKVNNREKQRIYEEELRKYVLKLMMDCCLRYAMM